MTNKKFLMAGVISLFIFANSASAAILPSGDIIAPDSPFYFFQTWKESIQTFFTFGAENKAKQYLHLAEVRLNEYKNMLEQGKTDIAEKTLAKYEKQLNRALDKADELKQKGSDVTDLSQKIEEATSKHLEVLQENLQKVPEQAKKGIENAIENSQKQIEKIRGETKACTQEAKICPDGTAVGRTGPNCEFARCPREEPQPSLQLDLSTAGEKIVNKTFSIKLIITPTTGLDSGFFTTPAEVKITLPSQIQLVEGELTQVINFTDFFPKSTEIKVKALAGGTFEIKATVHKQNSGEFNKNLIIKIAPSDSTANWKTYRNEEYGFEVKYPDNWVKKDNFSIDGGFFYVNLAPVAGIISQPLIVLRIYPNQTTLEKFLKYFDYIQGENTNRLIDNTSAKEIIYSTQDFKKSILVAFVKGGYGYEFGTSGYSEGEKTVNIANQILSTFKFNK